MKNFFSIIILFSFACGYLLPVLVDDMTGDLNVIYSAAGSTSEEKEEKTADAQDVFKTMQSNNQRETPYSGNLFSFRILKHDLAFYISEYHRFSIDEPPEA